MSLKNGTIKPNLLEQQCQMNILAYRLLKSANLSEQHEQLAKATVSGLRYDLMKDQLKRIFGDLSTIPTTSFSDSTKTENVN